MKPSPILNPIRLWSRVSLTSVLKNCMRNVSQNHLTRTHLSTWEWNLWCDDPMVYLKIHIQRCSEFLKPEYSFGVRVIVSQTLLKLVPNQCKTSAIISLLEEFGDSCNEVVVTALCEMWRKGGLWCVSARFVCSSGMTEPWYRGGITLVLNYVWLLIAAIHYTLPLYVILWYGHIAWYRFEHLDWRPSENWDHWVENASAWSWSQDISVLSHVLSFYFGDRSCLRRIWPPFSVRYSCLWLVGSGELWKKWRWAFDWVLRCHLRLGLRHMHHGSPNRLAKTSNYDGIWSIWAEFLACDEKKAAAD